MRHYPLFLDISRQAVLVVGAGEVGQRKIASLLEAKPQMLTIVDPAPLPASIQKNISPTVSYEQRPFTPTDVEGKFLVFAATHLPEVNTMVSVACTARGILCNIADAPEDSGFFVPASVHSGDIILTVSTGGASPALSRRMRMELEEWLENRYTSLAFLLKRLRPLVLALDMPSHCNAELFRKLVNSSLAECLAAKDHTRALALLHEFLPQALHRYTGDLLHDI